MSLLFGLLAPLLYALLPRRPGTLDAPVDVGRLAVAAGCMAAVAGWLALGLTDRESTRIVWLAAGAPAAASPVAIGGEPEGVSVGWPNGRFWPAFEARPIAGGSAEVRAWGGDGLVLLETPTGLRPLNGQALSATPRQVETALLSRRPPNRWSLSATSWCGPVVATIGTAMVEQCTKRESTTGLVNDVASTVATLRRAGGGGPATALQLEDLSRDLALYEGADGAVFAALHSLEPAVDSSTPATIGLPARIIVRWRGASLRATLQRRAGGALEIVFQPHWRFAVHPPDTIPDTGLPMVLVDLPKPDDVSLQLPFGRAFPEVRENLRLVQSAEGPIFDPTHTATLAPIRPAVSPLPGMDVVEDSLPREAATSRAVANLRRLVVTMATVRDASAGPLRVALLLFVPWMAFVLGLYVSRGISQRLAVVALALWALLLVRWLLALRYLAGPGGIDEGSRALWILASGALILGPGLYWMVAWPGPDDRERPSTGWLFWWLSGAAAVIAVAAVPVVLASAVLVPPGVVVEWKPFVRLASPVLAVVVVGLVGRGLWHTRRLVLFDPWQWLAAFIVACDRRSADLLAQLRGRHHWGTARRVGLLCFVLFVVGLVPLVAAMVERVTGTKFTTEVLEPMLAMGIVVGVFLGLRTAVMRYANDRVGAWIWLGLVIVGLLPFGYAILALEFGGAMAGTFWVAPLALALLFGGRHLGAAAVTSCVIAAVVIWGITVPVAQKFGYPLGTERGVSRLVVFDRGQSIVGALSLAGSRGTEGQLSATSLQNTVEHVWENQALAHRGRWTGLKYGQAPTQLSRVPKAVTQFDSTFSFYILGDHGLAGGLALLGLYAVPLLVLCAGVRSGSEQPSSTAAALIAAGLVVDASLHAAMNLGGLPFTGRNLPLLAAGSGADLLRWLLLLPMIPALHNAARPKDELPVRHTAWALPLPALGLAAYAAAVMLVVPDDKRLDSPFSWRADLNAVAARIEAGQVGLDAAMRAVTALPFETNGTTVLEQEAVRFNTLAPVQRGELPRELPPALRGLSTIAGYDDLMGMLSAQPATRLRSPSLFRITERVHNDGDGELETEYGLTANPDYNSVMTFDRTQATPQAFPRVVAGTSADHVTLLGAAWVNGAYRQVTGAPRDADRRYLLPWLPQLSRAAADAFPKGQETRLTLDLELQRAAQVWTRAAGRRQHQAYLETLAKAAPSDRRPLPFPPRLALTALDIRSGAVLASGSWPHAASHPEKWEIADGEPLPPLEWLETQAPKPLGLRYATDHNWARIEAGSAAKPLWAAAVLGVHPGLDRRLRVRGDGRDIESEVFGLPAGTKGWKVSPSPAWRTFRDFLAFSDNRFQIRLGFLGLVDGTGGGIEAEPQASPSQLESMTDPPRAWQRYPRYVARVRYSPAEPTTMGDAHLAPVAPYLRSRLGVGVAKGDTESRRGSYWSAVGASDANGAADLVSERLRALAPEATNLSLDTIASPRDYVSTLLGGRESRWSNVDLAAAFGSVVTGQPVVAHLVDKYTQPAGRATFHDDAVRIRVGLRAVVEEGTAASALAGARAALKRYGLVNLYAKTGTLSTDGGLTETSRLLLALVRWKDASGRDVERGVVLSLVIEHAQQGAAARVLGMFVENNAATLARLLDIQPAAPVRRPRR